MPLGPSLLFLQNLPAAGVSPPGPVAGLATPFFPPTYFAPTYFAPTYFPGGGSLAPLPPDFAAALFEWFGSDAVLTSAFPGGLVDDNHFAPGRPSPAVGYEGVDEHQPHTYEDVQVSAPLTVYAGTDAAAKDLSLLLLREVADVASRAPLRYEDFQGVWSEGDQTTRGPTAPRFVGRGVDGVPVWSCAVRVRFHFFKAEAE